MKKLLALCTSLLFVISSHATFITIEFDSSNYEIGDTLQADIVISDIEKDLGFQKLVAAFELGLSFDTSMLAYQSAAFGTALDVDPLLISDQLVVESTPGQLDISETSFALSHDLFTAQDGLSSFTLASLNFNVVADGLSSLTLNHIMLGDEGGQLFSQVSFLPADFQVGGSVSVPETPTLLLFTLSIMFLLVRKFKIN